MTVCNEIVDGLEEPANDAAEGVTIPPPSVHMSESPRLVADHVEPIKDGAECPPALLTLAAATAVIVFAGGEDDMVTSKSLPSGERRVNSLVI